MKIRNYFIFLLFISSTAIFLSFLAKPVLNRSDPPKDLETLGVMSEKTSDQVDVESQLDKNLLLPDIQVKELDDSAYIAISNEGKKVLHFPSTFFNTGDGPLELSGSSDEKNLVIETTQQIYRSDGTKKIQRVGSFVFHINHKHWHFENFVEFEIYSLKNGSELDQKIASTGKMTFCIHDYAPLPETFPGKPAEVVYPWCEESIGIQGISVGWVDTYTADVSGQEINITNITDGIYAFHATVDPENRLLEKNKNNNTSISYIKISGNNITILTGPLL